MPLWECWIKKTSKAISVKLYHGGIIGVYTLQQDADAEKGADKSWPDATKTYWECWLIKASKSIHVKKYNNGIIGVYATVIDANAEKTADVPWEQKTTTKAKSGIQARVVAAKQNYLQNRGEGDTKADIYQGNTSHPGYIRDLKYHLMILGFYRPKLKKQGKYRIRRSKLTDKWDAELKNAITYFHKVAQLEYRLSGNLKPTNSFDGGIPMYIDPVKLNASSGNTQNEINTIKVGDETKHELIRWLGLPYYYNTRPKNENPLKRNPYIYSFWEAFRQARNEPYRSGYFMYNKETGRVFHVPGSGFVCTTLVNWHAVHLMALGPNLGYYANAPIPNAWIQGKTYSKSGRRIKAAPRYYRNFFKPAFNVPWADPAEADNITLRFIKLLTLKQPYTRRTFIQIGEVAESDDLRTIPVLYRPANNDASSIQEVVLLSNKSTQFKVHRANRKQKQIILDEDLPAPKTKVIVKYKARDSLCVLPNKTRRWNHPNLKCKCGLHKAYAEIYTNRSKLGPWSIAGMSTVASGYDCSTLSIYYDKTADKLYSIHTGKPKFRTFEDEVKAWHGSKGVYYMIFTVDKNSIDKRNPVFFHHPLLNNTDWNPTKGGI